MVDGISKAKPIRLLFNKLLNFSINLRVLAPREIQISRVLKLMCQLLVTFEKYRNLC